MSIVAKKIMMGSGAVALPSDDEFNRTSFLSHFDGSNDGVNNQFTDASASNHTITAAGNVTQGSFGPFARPDGEWGVNFDGSGDYLEIADDSSLELGSGNFTIECFFNVKQFDSLRTLASKYKTVDGYRSWRLTFQTNGTLSLDITSDGGGSNISNVSTATVFEENTWYHLALVRSSNTITFYINGTADSNTLSFSATPHDNSTPVRIGTQFNSSGARYYHDGFVSNFRIVVGTALYTGNFTVPTAPLTAITNTKLLTCQSNRFVDNSTSGHTVTPSGNAAVTAFGPFLTSRVYNAAVNGASSSPLDVSTYLSIADGSWKTLGTGDFTWEFWFYGQTESTYMIGDATAGTNVSATFTLGVSSKRLILYYSIQGGEAYPLQSPNSAPFYNLNEWHHVAYVRSGNDHKIYANGVLRATETRSGTMVDSTGVQHIGNFGAGYASGSPTVFSDVRLVKGTAVYSGSTYTVPTAPLTAISNTELLLNFKDAQAIDSAAQNNLTLYGTAKLSTAQKKFGTASLLLDGNSDYAKTSGYVGSITGGKTIECWVYASNISSKMCIWEWYGDDNNLLRLFFEGGNGNVLRLDQRNGGNTIVGTTGATTLAATTWYHLAATRTAAGAWKVYINGTADGDLSASESGTTLDITDIPLYLGIDFWNTDRYWNGYIDDFRVSELDRYASGNFTAPAEPFADKGQ